MIVGFRWPYAVGPDTEPLQTKLDALRRYADTVIAAAGRVTGEMVSGTISPPSPVQSVDDAGGAEVGQLGVVEAELVASTSSVCSPSHGRRGLGPVGHARSS